MKVSIDGLRRSLAQSYNETVEAFNDDDREMVAEGLGDLRRFIGAMMCISSPDPEDLFSDMTDMIDRLKEPQS